MQISNRLLYKVKTFCKKKLESDDEVIIAALEMVTSGICLHFDISLEKQFNAVLSDINSNSHDIFSLNNQKLPCWQEGDLNLGDDWLTANNYYPVYFSVINKYSEGKRNVKFLEFGVRTGYIGALFAKVSNGSGLYVGVDINEYVTNGLELATQTLSKLKEKYIEFNYFLINGSTFDNKVQKTLRLNAPFDIIHIDGDHSLKGKLIDLYLASQIVHAESIVLVDDYDHLAEVVVEAIKRAINSGWFTKFYYIPTKRGLAILQK